MHLRVWEKLKSHKYISSAAAVLVVSLAIVFLSLNFSQGSIFNSDDNPRLGDCQVDNQGNPIGKCEDRWGRIRTLGSGISNDIRGMDSNGNKVSNHFWLEIDDIRPTGDSHKPQTYWMFKQGGYIADKVDTEDRNDFSQIHLTHSEFKWNSSIREAMERGTVCKASIKVSQTSQLRYYYLDNGEVKQQEYDDEDYYEPDTRKVSKLMPEPVTVEAEDIRITKNGMACKFDMTEILNKGAEYTPFVRWSGGYVPVIAGDDWDEGSTSLDIRFGTDYDGDNLTDHDGADQCPETAGVPEKNGCPNQVSKIVSVDGPRNVTVGEEVGYSVNIRNPDDDSTSISWSNGVTGDSAVYQFNSTGNVTVSVTTDDGFTEETREVRVRVEEKTLLGTFSDFLGGLWRILTFKG